MNDDRQIRVETHVARDFLQNAAYFNTIPKIVWEYVSNSLDAARDDRPVTVHVDISSNRICIADNGRGMSREELVHFFQMHGETTARQQGRYVRGRFGTGKCAAFGLASCLRIDTVQGERRNTVTLSRADIESARSGSPFPVTVLED
ncbi:MAG: ATP-binding protein, partial [Anaerolineales bacterium]